MIKYNDLQYVQKKDLRASMFKNKMITPCMTKYFNHDLGDWAVDIIGIETDRKTGKKLGYYKVIARADEITHDNGYGRQCILTDHFESKFYSTFKELKDSISNTRY